MVVLKGEVEEVMVVEEVEEMKLVVVVVAAAKVVEEVDVEEVVEVVGVGVGVLQRVEGVGRLGASLSWGISRVRGVGGLTLARKSGHTGTSRKLSVCPPWP